jgi:hypothetical protein
MRQNSFGPQNVHRSLSRDNTEENIHHHRSHPEASNTQFFGQISSTPIGTKKKAVAGMQVSAPIDDIQPMNSLESSQITANN